MVPRSKHTLIYHFHFSVNIQLFVHLVDHFFVEVAVTIIRCSYSFRRLVAIFDFKFMTIANIVESFKVSEDVGTILFKNGFLAFIYYVIMI